MMGVRSSESTGQVLGSTYQLCPAGWSKQDSAVCVGVWVGGGRSHVESITQGDHSN